MGLTRTVDFYDLAKELEPFHNMDNPEYFKYLHSNDEPPKFSALTVMKDIINELKRHDIKDYKGLRGIRQIRDDANKYANDINSQLHIKDGMIESLREQLSAAQNEITKKEEGAKVKLKPTKKSNTSKVKPVQDRNKGSNQPFKPKSLINNNSPKT